MTILAMKARPEAVELAVVGCGIGGEEYGISVEQVREVLRCPEITGIPGQPDFIVAFLVDSVSSIRKLDASAIRPIPAGFACRGSAFLRGVAPVGGDSDRWLLLLDLDRILSIEEENALKQVDEGRKS